MGQHKDILLNVQAQITDRVPELWVNKDCGQLNDADPKVEWPCALLDIEDVGFTQMSKGYQMADCQIVVTLGNTHDNNLPGSDPEGAYELIDLIDRLHDALQLFRPGDASPLFRTNLKKMNIQNCKESYKLTYETQYTVPYQDAGESCVVITEDMIEVLPVGD